MSAELASLDGSAAHSKARQSRLESELERIREQLAALGKVAQAAPTLRDVVMIGNPLRDQEGSLYRGRGAAYLS